MKIPPGWKRFNASDYLHSEEDVELFLQIARKEATGEPDALEQIISALRVAAEARSRMELAQQKIGRA